MDAATNPANIVTIGAFATVVFGGMTWLIIFLIKRQDTKDKEHTKTMAALTEVTAEALRKNATSSDALKASVDNLANRSKTESDYATLMVEMLKQTRTKET